MSESGWVVEGDRVILYPVTGFQVNPGIGTACAFQFRYFPSEEAAEKNDVRVVQLVMSLEQVEALRSGLDKAAAHLRSKPSGIAN